MNIQLGKMHAASYETDPKHLGFVLARYKFVAKMLTGYHRVLEVGCGDTTGASIVLQTVGRLIGVDIETPNDPQLLFMKHDILLGPVPGVMSWDAVYALDVLEHIKPEQEELALRNMCFNLHKEHGVLIIGLPSLESQAHASELSRLYHVNCKTEEGLRITLKKHFHCVFMFGMNDEMLHVGYGPMCHYRLAVCSGKK